MPRRNPYVVGRMSRAKKTREDLRDVKKLKNLIPEIDARIRAVVNSRAPKDLSPRDEFELKQAYRNELLRELCEVLGVEADIGEGKEIPADEASDERWRQATLTGKHVDRYGERLCQKCGKRITVMSKVVFQKGNPAMIRHSECHGAEQIGRWSVYMYEMKHLDKHGPSTCIGCGLPVSLGDSVAWRFGLKGVYHEACRPEE